MIIKWHLSIIVTVAVYCTISLRMLSFIDMYCNYYNYLPIKIKINAVMILSHVFCCIFQSLYFTVTGMWTLYFVFGKNFVLNTVELLYLGHYWDPSQLS